MPMLALLFATTSVAAASVPDAGLTVTLDGDAGKPMPLLGFGTCCRKSAKGGAPLIESTTHSSRRVGALPLDLDEGRRESARPLGPRGGGGEHEQL